ncbi:MAG: helix-hairpin-helix domain-containing protein [Gammaproteobacteria bacterium]|nr:helix-hairpin-helix domain-containing protein [Gammaproteobacteria bacterium]
MPRALTSISGIGPAAAEILKQHGFKSAEAIAKTSVEKLSAVPGFGAIRAENAIQAAIELVTPEVESQDAPEPVEKSAQEKTEKKSKSKGNKKSSKDKKNKDKKKSSKKDKKKKDKKKKKKK